jgi:hypothetical protein
MEACKNQYNIADRCRITKIVDLTSGRFSEHLGPDDARQSEYLSISGIATTQLGKVCKPEKSPIFEVVKEVLEDLKASFVKCLEEGFLDVQERENVMSSGCDISIW